MPQSLQLSLAQMDTAINRLIELCPDQSKVTQGVVVRSVTSPSIQIRNLPERERNEKLRTVVVTVATSYCGALPANTSEVVWRECIGHAERFYPGFSVDEILEAFRLASAHKYTGIDLAAYHGQFTVKLFGDVMKAYLDDRNRIRAALEKAADEIMEAEKDKETERKNQEAAAFFVSEFRALQEAGTVIPYEEIKFYWFDAVYEAGLLNDLDEEVKRELWKTAKEMAARDFTHAVTVERSMTTQRAGELVEQIKEGNFPAELSEKRKSIYKKLLLEAALLQAAQDREFD